MSEVYLRLTKHGRDTVVAVCDAELLGKTLEGGRVPFKVKKSFYQGVKGDIEEALEAMDQATICNIVGKKIVEAAIKRKLIHKNAVIFFGETPHAQIVRL